MHVVATMDYVAAVQRLGSVIYIVNALALHRIILQCLPPRPRQ